MSSPRVFTVAEVNALIPTLSQLVGRQLLDQSDIERGLAELTRLRGGSPASLDRAPDDTPEVSRLKADLRERVLRYETGWREVRALGAVVKDPHIGLLDFYGRVNGRLVWLCWRYGEEALGFYHDLEAGYSSRQPLHEDTRARLLN
jgi:hypothetical protein